MNRLRLRSTFLPLLAWMCSSAFIFRRAIRSGFDILPGDELDSRLILRIQEHWYRFFTGRAEWLDLGMFYPTQNSLGFSDTFFLYGLTHSLFRSLRLDLFHACMANLFLLSAIGFSGMYLLCRRALKFTPPLSIFLSAMFLCLSPVNMATIYMHTQIYSVWYIPWVALLGHGFYQSLNKPLRQNAKWAIATGAAYALTLYNAVYIPWFLAIFVASSASIGLGLHLFKNAKEATSTRMARAKQKLDRLGTTLKRQRAKWIILALVSSISLTPFFLTYLPILKVSHGHSYATALKSLPYLSDLANTGHWSIAWGWFGSILDRPGNAYGLPLASLALTLGSITFGLIFYRSQFTGLKSELCVKSISAGVLICWLLMLRVGDQSLWIIPFELVPGASAIRVVYRFNVLLTLPILALWGISIEYGLQKLRAANLASAKTIPAYAALTLLTGFLFLEQSLSTPSPDSNEWNLKRSRITNRLAEIPPPPPDAKIFFVTPYEQHGSLSDMRSQLEAWAIAQDYNLKTLNGYSGITPKQFQLFGIPGSTYPHEYDSAVNSWILSNEIQEPVHRLDLNAKTWSQYDPRARERELPPYPLGKSLFFDRANSSKNPYELSKSLMFGWSIQESGHTWTDGNKAELVIRLSEPSETSLLLRMKCFAFINGKHPKQRIHFSVNDQRIGTAEPNDFLGTDWYELTIPRAAVENASLLRIRIDCPDAKAPADIHDSSDNRKLGLGLIELIIEPQ